MPCGRPRGPQRSCQGGTKPQPWYEPPSSVDLSPDGAPRPWSTLPSNAGNRSRMLGGFGQHLPFLEATALFQAATNAGNHSVDARADGACRATPAAPGCHINALRLAASMPHRAASTPPRAASMLQCAAWNGATDVQEASPGGPPALPFPPTSWATRGGRQRAVLHAAFCTRGAHRPRLQPWPAQLRLCQLRSPTGAAGRAFCNHF